jgi:hypothetical protein
MAIQPLHFYKMRGLSKLRNEGLRKRLKVKIIDPGHVYELDWLDGTPLTIYPLKDDEEPRTSRPENRLTFVKREGDGYPGNVGHHAGTNIQEVLRALIDRVRYLDKQIPDWRNLIILDNLRMAMYNLEGRAAERHGRTFIVHDMSAIETLPTCEKCKHIGCEGACH